MSSKFEDLPGILQKFYYDIRKEVIRISYREGKETNFITVTLIADRKDSWEYVPRKGWKLRKTL